MMSLSDKEIFLMLQNTRQRGNYVNALREFLDDPEWEPPKSTRRQRLKWKWEDRKYRISRAWQILRSGYYDGEGE